MDHGGNAVWTHPERWKECIQKQCKPSQSCSMPSFLLLYFHHLTGEGRIETVTVIKTRVHLYGKTLAKNAASYLWYKFVACLSTERWWSSHPRDLTNYLDKTEGWRLGIKQHAKMQAVCLTVQQFNTARHSPCVNALNTGHSQILDVIVNNTLYYF